MKATRLFAHLGAAALLAWPWARRWLPLPVDDFAKIPAIQSVTMSPDGKQLVAIIAAPGSNNGDTALANWNLDNLGAGPVAITPSGDRMKFIAASALKAGRSLVIGRQELTAQLAGCGEGNSVGNTKTFLSKAYLTDTSQTVRRSIRRHHASLASANRHNAAWNWRELRHWFTRSQWTLTRSSFHRSIQSTFSAGYYLFNLKTGQTELLFRGDARSTPGLFHPRSELLTRDPDRTGRVERVRTADPDQGQGKRKVREARCADNQAQRLHDGRGRHR